MHKLMPVICQKNSWSIKTIFKKKIKTSRLVEPNDLCGGKSSQCWRLSVFCGITGESQVVKHVHRSMIKPIPPNLFPQEPSMVEPDLHKSITEEEETHDGVFVVTRSRCDAAPAAQTSQVNLNNSNGSPGLSSWKWT